MNNGQFSGISNSATSVDAIPIGSLVRFPSSAPLEVVLPNGQVYLRAGELTPEISRYNTRFPRHMVSDLGSIGVGDIITFTGSAWSGANVVRCFYPLSHGTSEHAVILQSTGIPLHCANINGGTTLANLDIGALPQPASRTTQFSSSGSVGIALASSLGTAPEIWRTADASFLTGWAVQATSTITLSGTFNSAFVLNNGTTWIAFAGSSGVRSLSRSTDNGVSWTHVEASTVWPEVFSAALGESDVMATVIPATNIVVVAMFNANAISAPQRPVFIRRSTDNGATYNLTATVESSGVVTGLIGLAAGNGVVVGVTNIGDVVISRDQGVSWRREGFIPAVAFDAALPLVPGTSNNRLFFKNGRFWITAGLSNGIRNRVVVYCSTDGVNWSAAYVNAGPSLSAARAVVVNPTASNVTIWQAFSSLSASRNTLPFGQYVNNAIPAEAITLASGSVNYIRVA